jgi:hypothetical protein
MPKTGPQPGGNQFLARCRDRQAIDVGHRSLPVAKLLLIGQRRKGYRAACIDMQVGNRLREKVAAPDPDRALLERLDAPDASACVLFAIDQPAQLVAFEKRHIAIARPA